MGCLTAARFTLYFVRNVPHRRVLAKQLPLTIAVPNRLKMPTRKMWFFLNQNLNASALLIAYTVSQQFLDSPSIPMGQHTVMLKFGTKLGPYKQRSQF